MHVVELCYECAVQISHIHSYNSKSKVKQSLYTPWRRLGGEEV
jgi:hypothetical protein